MKHSFFLRILKAVATVAGGTGKRRKLFILIYHRVFDKPDFMRPGEADIAEFTWQMALLSKYFNVLPLHEALQKRQAGTLPARAACITFDDGYADNYRNALPILNRFGLTATFFIASGFLNGGRMWNDTVIEAVRNFPGTELDLSAIGLGRFEVGDQAERSRTAAHIIRSIKHAPPASRDQYTAFIASQSPPAPDDLMMTSGELLELRQNGMEIGGHTQTHPILAKLDDDTAWREIEENKSFLDKLLPTPTRYFAYPNGKPGQDYLPRQIPLLAKAGYLAAVSTEWGLTDRGSDIWQLPRFTPWDKTPLKFMLRMIRLYLKGKP